MKIVLYKDNLATGRGADKAICSLAGALAERHHEITLATCSDSVKFSFPVGAGVSIVRMERSMAREFTRSFDLCIAAGPNEILDLTLGGKERPPVKTIVELLVYPMGFFKWRHFIRNRRLKKALNLADVLQVQIKGYGECLRAFAPRPRIAVIGNWADIAEPPAGRRERKTILYLAAINKKKNQMLAIRAFAELADEFPEWELHLYGAISNKYGTRCKAVAEKGGLGARIKFFPFTNDLPSAYSSASIMAYPSLLEGFPLAMVEGMKYRLPVVAVDSLPGVGDMVVDGENGVVTKPTVKAYADGLRRLMADAELRRVMGDAAHEFVLDRYSRERILGKWEELLGEEVSACGLG